MFQFKLKFQIVLVEIQDNKTGGLRQLSASLLEQVCHYIYWLKGRGHSKHTEHFYWSLKP